jgi:hypothetical protein
MDRYEIGANVGFNTANAFEIGRDAMVAELSHSTLLEQSIKSLVCQLWQECKGVAPP